MKNHLPDDAAGLEPDREEALWKLLGQSPATRVSPYFTRRVLRDLDAGPAVDSAAGWRAWLQPGWLLAAAGGVIVMTLGLLSFSSRPVAPPPALASRAEPAATRDAAAAKLLPAVIAAVDDVTPQDVEIIADLDNAVAREETSVWADETSRF